eukprot:TRINITY_DN11726_c0_g1_i12.p4 TRINITY_DN11726_c0_g1~~TRINITY_DN11726_c0_g1_i12.p4  ORF type:complete len:212 (-),score=-9.95 TRINITY_DN11726_c0_g1_i12:204-839(-)
MQVILTIQRQNSHFILLMTCAKTFMDLVCCNVVNHNTQIYKGHRPCYMKYMKYINQNGEQKCNQQKLTQLFFIDRLQKYVIVDCKLFSISYAQADFFKIRVCIIRLDHPYLDSSFFFYVCGDQFTSSQQFSQQQVSKNYMHVCLGSYFKILEKDFIKLITIIFNGYILENIPDIVVSKFIIYTFFQACVPKIFEDKIQYQQLFDSIFGISQ